MKVADYGLDLATGDATLSDAYIAYGQTMVEESCNQFEIAKKIYEADEPISDTVMEAVFGAGISDAIDGTEGGARIRRQRDLASKRGCAAFAKCVEGLYTVSVKSANKTKELVGGVEKYVSFINSNIGVATLSTKRQCITGRDAIKIAKAYTIGMACYANGFGYSIGSIFSNGDVRACVGSAKAPTDGVDTVGDMVSCFNKGLKMIGDGQLAASTRTLKKSDIEDILTAIKCITTVSKRLNEVLEAGGAKASVEMVRTACEAAEGPTARRHKAFDIDDYMTKAPYWSKSVTVITATICKQFRDTIMNIHTELVNNRG